MADNLGIMLTELPEATNIGDDDLMYIVQENNSEKVKAKTIKDSLLGDFYGEASGNPASFADGAAAGLVECIADIEAAQDLHGYDKPWAGGGGKNKLPLTLADIKTLNSGTWTDNSITIAGVTYTVNTDSDGNVISITAEGTASAQSNFTLAAFDAYGGQYTLGGCPSGGANSRYNIRIDDYSTGTNYCADDGSGTSSQTMNVTAGTSCRARIRVYANVNPNGAIFYPQLEAGTTPTTFEPYTNICPISGHSSVTINVSPTSDPSQGVDTTIQLGDTYYSGTLNTVTGELAVTHGAVDLGTLSWTYYTSGTNPIFYAPISDTMIYGNNEDVHAISANYSNYGLASTRTTLATRLNNGDFSFISEGTNVVIRDDNYTSASDFTTAMDGVMLVYELATPLTIQLASTTINALDGQNYISSEDAEDIDLVYTKLGAPIKPNPSGEADGYLSSIELSGKKFEIIKELPAFPSSNGNYKLKLSISNGVPTLSWVSDT